MAEDLPAEEILKQISERLDLFERVLATNTARLHDIEKHLGIETQQQDRLAELFAAEQSEMQSSAGEAKAAVDHRHHPAGRSQSQSKPQDLNSSEASQPTRVSKPADIAPQQTRPPTQTPEQSGFRSDQKPPPTTEPPPATPPPPTDYSRRREASIPHTGDSHSYSTRAADAPSTLRLNVELPEADDEPSPSAQLREERHRDLESTIGGSWFNWIGIIAVTFGVGFFLKYAFDKQWIGPAGRVSLSALVGIGLLYLGERLRRQMKSYAYVLSGGGILILYLSVFAAYNFYHLISQPMAFLLMAGVTTTAVLLSVRLDALPVALLALVGGFLTPLLLSTGVDNEVGLFTYIALLDAGVLAVAYFKHWRSLDFASFVGTVGITLGWANKFYESEKIWTTIFFLSVFFLLYSLLAIFHNVLRRRLTRWFDVALAIANASFYFGLSYVMLDEAGFDHAAPATQALLVSIFFTGLFYWTWRWSARDLLLRYSYVGAAATFLTIAAGILLELHWVTMAWALEALMLTWVGLRSGEKAARHSGLAVFSVAIGHWFLRDMLAIEYSLDSSFLPLLNRRALSGAVLVGAIAGASRLYKRVTAEGKPGDLERDERSTVLTFFALTGNALALTLLSLDINDYFMSRKPVNSLLLSARIENARQFSISMLWTIYAAMILAAGLLRRSLLLRAGGLLLLMVVIGKVLFVDSAYYAASWHLPLVNQTFLAYALLVAALVFAAKLYRRTPDVYESDESERAIVPILLGVANVLALTALSLEVIGYYDRALAGLMMSSAEIRRLEEGKFSTLAIVWTIYAVYAFMVGIGRSNQILRFGGLLLMAVTAPLILLNLSYYNAPWHTLVINRTMGVFAVFIAALWLIVRAYRRSSEEFAEAAAVHQVVIVAANVLAITAMSFEVIGYYDRLLAGVTMASAETVRQFAEGKISMLAIVWAIYALYAFMVGIGRSNQILRLGGLLLMAVTTPLVLANLSYANAPWHTFVINPTMGVFAVFIAALWLIVRAYRRSSEAFAEAAAVHHVAIVTANVLAIIALSAQAAGYYDAKIAEVFNRSSAAALTADANASLQTLELAKQLSLSVLWAVYASGLLVVGQIRRLLLLRVMGLTLLSITAIKVFIWDLSSLDRVYRVISFIMLGAILLVVSYFYQRKQHAVEET